MRGRIGAVVIGRDEGERLLCCLASLRGRVDAVVYADSGSRDGSAKRAKLTGAQVVELDPARPFTAARGRNEGLARLRSVVPDVELVQFVDGDCELREGWIEAGRTALQAAPDVAAVAGRLRERNREGSIYQRLCDLEWDRPTGETDAVGGNAMMRISALEEVGGFDEAIPAGEEPELCLRLRREGWRILRLPDEMMWHDADMTRFDQWWRRAERAGLALALVVGRPSAGSTLEKWRPVISTLGFGMLVPAALLSFIGTGRPGLALAVLAGLAVQAWRIQHSERGRGRGMADAWLVAFFTLLGKIPGSMGVLRGLVRRRLSPDGHS